MNRVAARRAHDILRPPAQHAFERGTGERHDAVGAGDHEDVGAVLHERAEPFLAATQRFLRLLAFGDVAKVQVQRADRGIVDLVRGQDLHPPPDLQPVPDAHLPEDLFTGGVAHPAPLLHRMIEIVGMDQLSEIQGGEGFGTEAEGALHRRGHVPHLTFRREQAHDVTRHAGEHR